MLGQTKVRMKTNAEKKHVLDEKKRACGSYDRSEIAWIPQIMFLYGEQKRLRQLRQVEQKLVGIPPPIQLMFCFPRGGLRYGEKQLMAQRQVHIWGIKNG